MCAESGFLHLDVFLNPSKMPVIVSTTENMTKEIMCLSILTAYQNQWCATCLKNIVKTDVPEIDQSFDPFYKQLVCHVRRKIQTNTRGGGRWADNAGFS